MKTKLLSCFLGGVLMASAIAPISLIYAAWFGLIPLWLGLVTQLENHNFIRLNFVQFRSALSLAIVWGIGFYGFALFWITGVHPLTWMGVPWLASLGIALFCWFALTFWGILLVSSWAIGFILWQQFILFKIPSFSKTTKNNSLNNSPTYNHQQTLKNDKLFLFFRGARGENIQREMMRDSSDNFQINKDQQTLKNDKLSHFLREVRGDYLQREMMRDSSNNFQTNKDQQNLKNDKFPPFLRGARGDYSKKNHFYNIIGRLIWGVTLWCILETLWSYSPLWWSSLASTQSPNNLWFLQWGQIAGPNILTAFIVFINGILAEIILLCWTYKIKAFFIGLLLAIPVIFIIIIHITGYFIYSNFLVDQAKTMITVGIIQGNIPNKIKLYPEGLEKAIAAYTQGYQDLVRAGSEVVLTPEGALPYFWEDIVNYSSFYQAILQAKIPVWLGAYGHQKNEEKNYTNSLFSVNAQGKLIGRYDKVKLVPLGEYIPLKAILGKIISRLSPLKGELSPGNSQQIFHTTFGNAIVSICYESAFPELIRKQVKLGGEFILSSANNAHYSDKMPAQHHALDVMRAIESDRWVARATNTGYSAIISPQGKTLWLSELNNYQIHQGKIYRRQTKTFYVQYGDLFTPFLIIIIIVFWVIPAALFRIQSQRAKPRF